MLCLSVFELYSRWVPLNKLKYIPNFLLFFQFRFDLLEDLTFRSVSG